MSDTTIRNNAYLFSINGINVYSRISYRIWLNMYINYCQGYYRKFLRFHLDLASSLGHQILLSLTFQTLESKIPPSFRWLYGNLYSSLFPTCWSILRTIRAHGVGADTRRKQKNILIHCLMKDWCLVVIDVTSPVKSKLGKACKVQFWSFSGETGREGE